MQQLDKLGARLICRPPRNLLETEGSVFLGAVELEQFLTSGYGFEIWVSVVLKLMIALINNLV